MTLGQPDMGFGSRADGVAARLVWASDHEDRDGQVARSLDFWIRRGAAGILGHDDADFVVTQEAGFARAVERASRCDEIDVGRKGRAIRHFDTADEVGVLWRVGKGRQVLPADAEKYAARVLAQGQHRGIDIGHDRPAILRGLLPLRPENATERNAEARGRFEGIGGDARGERMRGIDNGFYLFPLEPVGKPARATEPTDARFDVVLGGVCRAASQRQRGAEPAVVRDATDKLGRFRSASEDQDAH